ncbi:prepilin peptidase [Apilactobacillus apinorum]|uniref:prepilin peptidase n=1 Tax=Apilactobacillus apinorum TaxID=1218495 RepID=UPI0006C1E06C|nr:hypothetical protein RZ74_09730 [Apilactobacillus apinorum]CAI2685054.1 Hypothetical protein AAPFHON13_10550 [Apilactobacillus apinorum]
MLIISFLGACVGSFISALFHRYKHQQKLTGRSHCDHCNHSLTWFDLIPIISFILLFGKCRYCRYPISYFSTLIEINLFILFPLIYSLTHSISLLMVVSILLYLSIQDMESLTVSINPLIVLLCFTVIHSNFLSISIALPFYLLLTILNERISMFGQADIDILCLLYLLFSTAILYIIIIACIYALIYFLINRFQVHYIPFVPYIYLAVLTFICIQK